MCWVTFETPNKKIVPKGEQIPIYKIVILKNYFFFKEFSSYYKGFVYKLNKLYSTKLFGPIPDEIHFVELHKYTIHKGIHSYSTIRTKDKVGDICVNICSNEDKRIDSYYLRHILPGKLVKVFGYIPEGATYYENEIGEIVSDKIVLTNYEKYKPMKYK